ncbi:MAG: ribonuclease D [Solirubrobacteraceae bacterium]|nr:ribonuclease D [Solirubrobacteraceae bacterium]
MDDLATTSDIEEVADAARAAGRFGIDTEFMGEGRYRSQLCVVQVAVEDPDGEVRVIVVDALDADVDVTPLAEILADPAIEVVMHAARQDVPLLKRTWDVPVTNLFDTQIAAGFAGLRAQLGYDPLLQEMLGVRLRKSASFTKWDRRPLTEEQARYAREDVLHLLQVATKLQERLEALGRLEWAREECRPLEAISDLREVETVFAKLPKINGLDPKVRAIAWELAAWREDTAREADRPVTTVLNDAALVEIAKRKPAEQRDLEQIRGLNEGALRRRGRSIIEAVKRGRERDPVPNTASRHIQPDAKDAPLIALAEALVRTRAMDAELAYELIAARADLQRIVTAVRVGADTGAEAQPDIRTLQGWRRELVGEELLELLHGRRELRVGADLGVEVRAQDATPTT